MGRDAHRLRVNRALRYFLFVPPPTTGTEPLQKITYHPVQRGRRGGGYLEKTAVWVFQKELEYKVEKLKYTRTNPNKSERLVG